MTTLELKLRRIVEKRLEEGWEVRPVGYESRVVGGRCCLLGAVAIDTMDVSRNPGALKIGPLLGLEYAEVRALENGFEDWAVDYRIGLDAKPDGLDELAAIGARIRRDYCEFDNE